MPAQKMTRTQPRWVKSSYSRALSNCVEVASLPGAVGVRDSKHPAGPVLVVGSRAWGTLVARIKAGQAPR
jgi:hypothetical protein